MTIQGKAHLAVHRRNIDTHSQFITIYKTLGDKTGTLEDMYERYKGPLSIN
jgi:hypothetical protein